MHKCACEKSKLTRVQPRFVFTRYFSKLTRIEPTSGGGLNLTRVEPGLAVFTQQKLTWVEPTSGGGLNVTRVEPGLAVFTRQKLTQVSLCRVNRSLMLLYKILEFYVK